MNLTRRKFCYIAGACGVAMGAGWVLRRKSLAETPGSLHPIVDCHVHLFGAGDAAGIAENERCVISSTQRRHWTFSYLTRLLNIPRDGPLDDLYVERLLAQLRASSVDRVVL